MVRLLYKSAEQIGERFMNKLIGLAGALTLAMVGSAHAQQMPTGLQGIKIAVADYERATRFYAILGMAPGMKYNELEWQLRWTEPARGVPVIMVRDPAGRIGVVKGGASLMISVADVAGTVARLRTAGFAIAGETHSNPRATIMMIKDPDGNSIELLGPPASVSAAPTPHP
jgi:predicted enzyme related to lactoylglutathione lyase